MKTIITILAISLPQVAGAAEFHVAVTGHDGNEGAQAKPFKTIAAAKPAATKENARLTATD